MATKKKVTLYVDEDVMRAARVRAARTDKRDSEVVEDALRSLQRPAHRPAIEHVAVRALDFEIVEMVQARATPREQAQVIASRGERAHHMRAEEATAASDERLAHELTDAR